MLHFFDMLFPPRDDELALRYVSDSDFLALVAPRLVSATRPGTVVLLPFSDQRVRSAVHEAKYHGSARAFTLLTLALLDYLRDSDDIGTTRLNLVVLVPIPLGKARRKERGFNQTEEVAKRAAKQLGGALVDTTLLARTRETVSQVSLPRHKREENMRGAFGAAHSVDPSRTYVIIDDVLTTGATLQAAVDALRKAGAVHIVPLALAH
jgi:ComF family protein